MGDVTEETAVEAKQNARYLLDALLADCRPSDPEGKVTPSEIRAYIGGSNLGRD